MSAMLRKRPLNRLAKTSHPVLYEVNTGVLLNELSREEGKRITLATVPDRVLDEWAALGFDAIWLMGVWTTGPLGLEIARDHPGLQEEYHRALPDYTPGDIAGSPFAVSAYEVSEHLGGKKALQVLRERMADRSMGVVLDFICNHTARDHEWVTTHPEYYVQGEPGDQEKYADRYFAAKTSRGEKILAFGRDPTYPAWTDTAQMNHTNADMRRALIDELKKVASQCDGVRCDMAMLVLKDVFARTWGDRVRSSSDPLPDREFWDEAIRTVRKDSPSFVFIAEAYWNLEWELQQLGFNYTYDKRLYDRLLREGASSVRDHLKAELDFQLRSVRFIENHDEDRAAHALQSESWHYAAAVIAATTPGMFLVHEGQMEGRAVKLPVQLARRQDEPVSARTISFYRQLLSCLSQPIFQKGIWHLLDPRPSWHDNLTWQNFLVFWWGEESNSARLVVVNYAPHSGQCYVDIPTESIEGNSIDFRDLMGTASYVREKAGLMAKGMYFDLPGYGLHIFDIKPGRK